MTKPLWYHGSPVRMALLRTGSTITPWRELAEAFSHKPRRLCIDDDGNIIHDGSQSGYLYLIDEPVETGADIFQHPRTSMEEGLEYLTSRPLRLKLLCTLPAPDSALLEYSERLLEEIIRNHTYKRG